MQSLASDLSAPSEPGGLELSVVYDTWFGDALHWLRSFGVPEADLEDVAQEVFLVVQRKLPTFGGGNLPGWLYRIAARTASDYRRRSWFRNLFSRAQPLDEDAIELNRPTPVEQLERKQAQRILYRLIMKMSLRRRSAFMLFEIEGYSAEEIAALEGIPVATVRTRLHHARKDFYKRVVALQRKKES
jgi:RNA polymerase sigma-70 factor, ECF subfamily